MKNLTTAISFITTVLLSIQAGRYFRKTITGEKKETELLKIVHSDFDKSLRNFHPNKGE